MSAPTTLGRCFTCSGGGTVPARVPGRWVDCLNCDGTGRVLRALTVEQRLERIEEHLGVGLLLTE